MRRTYSVLAFRVATVSWTLGNCGVWLFLFPLVHRHQWVWEARAKHRTSELVRSQLSRWCQLYRHQGLIFLYLSYGILWRWSHVWWLVWAGTLYPSKFAKFLTKWCTLQIQLPMLLRLYKTVFEKDIMFLCNFVYFRYWWMCYRNSQLSLWRQLHQHQGFVLLHVSYGILWRWSGVYR